MKRDRAFHKEGPVFLFQNDRLKPVPRRQAFRAVELGLQGRQLVGG
jgi:hypothetical protein